MRKKLLSWGDNHCVAEDSRIRKMTVIIPLQALVHPQTHINYPAWIVNPNPKFPEFAVFGKYICRLGIVDFNLPSN
jgi:hypothetical protein